MYEKSQALERKLKRTQENSREALTSAFFNNERIRWLHSPVARFRRDRLRWSVQTEHHVVVPVLSRVELEVVINCVQRRERNLTLSVRHATHRTLLAVIVVLRTAVDRITAETAESIVLFLCFWTKKGRKEKWLINGEKERCFDCDVYTVDISVAVERNQECGQVLWGGSTPKNSRVSKVVLEIIRVFDSYDRVIFFLTTFFEGGSIKLQLFFDFLKRMRLSIGISISLLNSADSRAIAEGARNSYFYRML